MLSIKNWPDLSLSAKQQCLTRPLQATTDMSKVQHIIQEVRTQGDQALIRFTQQFDSVSLTKIQLDPQKIYDARIDSSALNALNKAVETITKYHQSLLPEDTSITTAPGITVANTYRPIQKVGLYVPGGNKTPLISSLLMQAIPAKVAGCSVKVLCTPPDNTGNINPHLLAAARLCDIDTIYTIGGAQAIAAMAYGTASVTKVDKLFGPGNSFVTCAKTLVAMDPEGSAIDMPAGPSEVMILADNQANPKFIAADLLAQAEHGPDSQVLLICESMDLAHQVNEALKIQLTTLSRAAIISKSLAFSQIICCAERSEQLNIINTYAPEHLIINRQDADDWVNDITAVGTVFLGSWAAETMGDYVTGSNHVLPTNGFARNHNGLSTLDFLTRFTVQSINERGIRNLGPTAVTLAQLEGLDAHAQAVQIRLQELGV